jgi:hypothetical protein
MIRASYNSSDFAMYLTRGFCHNVGNVSTPSFECLLALREELVPLVYGRNPRDRAGIVIENLVGDVRRNPEAGHPGYAGPAEVMKAPPGHSGELIE